MKALDYLDTVLSRMDAQALEPMEGKMLLAFMAGPLTLRELGKRLNAALTSMRVNQLVARLQERNWILSQAQQGGSGKPTVYELTPVGTAAVKCLFAVQPNQPSPVKAYT